MNIDTISVILFKYAGLKRFFKSIIPGLNGYIYLTPLVGKFIGHNNWFSFRRLLYWSSMRRCMNLFTVTFDDYFGIISDFPLTGLLIYTRDF